MGQQSDSAGRSKRRTAVLPQRSRPSPVGMNPTMRQIPSSNRSDRGTTTGRVIIFDTTLRDGEQSPGASMTLDE